MSTNTPTKPPEPPPVKSEENKFDRFRPEMPTIPGVSKDSAAAGNSRAMPQLLQIAGISVAVVLVGAVIFWGVKVKSRASVPASTETAVAEMPAPSPEAPVPAAPVRDTSNVAATVDELSKPWDSKKFNFANHLTQENIDAMVIRLPGGGLWAFSLRAPFGRCELEFVTDLGVLASQYKFNATHPMVVSPCDGTVYDPMKVGSLGGDTWTRGEIVKGSSLRPPISIDVKVNGRSIVADRIE